MSTPEGPIQTLVASPLACTIAETVTGFDALAPNITDALLPDPDR